MPRPAQARSVLLVVPPHAQWYTQPHLGPGYLAGSLRRAGVETRIFDAQLSADPVGGMLEAVRGADAAGFTANVVTLRPALRMIEALRERRPDIPVWMGGPQPTAVHERLLAEHPGIVVLGEGEETIVDLALGRALDEIPGLAYREADGENGHIHVTAPRPPRASLDEIPHPAWDAFPLERYRFVRSPRTIAPMITSRGCPYPCMNCTKAVHGARTRHRSIGDVMAEIETLHRRHGAGEIHFWDDNFTLPPARAKALSEAILGAGLDLKFALPNGMRADIGDPEMFRLMARAGFYWVAIAIESGSQETVDRLGKRLDLAQVPRTVRLARANGMLVTLFFIWGLPFDTRESLADTERMALALPAHQVFFFRCLPFPGTPLHDLVKAEGRFLSDPVDGFLSYDSDEAVFEMPALPAAEVTRMRRRAYRRFYFRPAQIARTLRMHAHWRNLGVLPDLARAAWRFLLRGTRI